MVFICSFTIKSLRPINSNMLNIGIERLSEPLLLVNSAIVEPKDIKIHCIIICSVEISKRK